MCAFQREASGRVFELWRDLRWFPSVGEMALRARRHELTVRIRSSRLGPHRPRQKQHEADEQHGE
jgi:hypothetical protein